MSYFRHAMLSPVLDVLKSSIDKIPFGEHTFFQRLAKAESENLIREMCELTDISGEEKAEAFELLDIINDAIAIFTKEAKNTEWQALSVEQRNEKVKAIQEAPQVPQRSEEWFRQYGKVLTASEFSTIFQHNKKRRDLVFSKSHPPMDQGFTFRHACPTDEITSLSWGIRFEPVVKLLLEHHDKCKIYEAGRLNHKTNTHLAASPDGVIESALNPKQVGRLVEIKCPYSRAIGKEIPSDYWIQMQIQMEVADVDECEYVECDIVSKKANQDEVDLSGTTYSGFVYLCKQTAEEDQPFDYKYVYGAIGSSEMPEIPEGYECVEVIPWGLKAWYRKIVSRDRSWYQATIPWQDAFWDDVERAKKGEEISSNTMKATACLITDD